MSTVPASAGAARADLVVTVTADPTEVVDTGGWSAVQVDVRNAGGKATRDIALTFAPPAGAWFFSDGFTVPESWQCDLVETLTCTRDPLAAGEAADPLRLPLGLPAGVAGETVTVSATGTTGAREASTENNTGQVTLRYFAGVADLDLTRMTTNTESAIVGESISVAVDVQNAGTAAASDVTVTVPLPSGMTRESEYAEGWDCALSDDAATGQSSWRCTRESLAAREIAGTISLSAKVMAGNTGDTVTFTAKATTSSPEASDANNSGQATTTILQSGTVRGTVWVDSDRDGIRDPDEPGAPSGTEGTSEVVVKSKSGQPSVVATLGADGTYIARVRPGSYVVEFYVLLPYLFTDSADSDLVNYYNYTGGQTNLGFSDVIDVAGGDEVVIDAAVVR
jgi:uncharacterized repeat protein (TIGR01451 family)